MKHSIGGEKMSAVKIPFAIQPMGYNREQVDGYIQKLMNEYANLQRMFAELDELLKDQPISG